MIYRIYFNCSTFLVGLIKKIYIIIFYIIEFNDIKRSLDNKIIT